MNSPHEDAIVELLTETVQHYVDYQEDELGKPVLKREYFWGIARHFINTLVSLAAHEAEPVTVVDSVLQQVRARTLMFFEWLRDEPDPEEDNL
jgi:hypothetical protein